MASLSVSPVSAVPPVLHTHLHLHVARMRQLGHAWGPTGSTGQKATFSLGFGGFN